MYSMRLIHSRIRYICKRLAEVLITADGEDLMIRRREDLEDLVRQLPEQRQKMGAFAPSVNSANPFNSNPD